MLLSCCFSQTPVSLGGAILFLSGLISVLIGNIISSWYGILLFLIYVGGLLVLFLYVIMLRRNFVVSFSLNLAIFFLLINIIIIIFTKDLNLNLERLIFECSIDFSIGTFLRLGILLLVVFFSVVHIVLRKGRLIIVIG